MLDKVRSSIDGQDLVEYALLTGLISIVLVSAVTILGSQFSGFFSITADKVDSIGAEPTEETPPDCHGSLLWAIMVSVASLGVGFS